MRTVKQLRADARRIFEAGIAAVDPVEAVKRHLGRTGDILHVADRRYELPTYRHVYVVGTGKASARMARGLEEILGESIDSGVVVVKYGYSTPTRRVDIVEAGHPIPDPPGVEGTKQIIDTLRKAGNDDLVIFLVSGGGSALLPCPADGLTLEDKQRTTQILLDCGATIHEINSVRKHLSKVKGGRLARLAYPATVVGLILSDVIGDRLEGIASGPTVPDTSTFSDCLKIIERYQLQGKIPPVVRAFLEQGARGGIEETPKAADPVFEKVQNVLVGSNRLALQAAKQKADALGYNSLLLSSSVEGETQTVAAVHAAIAKEISATGGPVRRPACVISGGETTVTIRGGGLGGRNQEFALAAALHIEGLEGIVILSGGTDGTDGPTDAAGGVVDSGTLRRATANGLDAGDYLRRNDSYHFLQSTGDLLITGPTYTNVMDLHVMLIA
ncbi:MAG TPA: glycerate kinase [Candidatus Udaeobacter sp.]|nr:glycerate kinase [Candidatus Udaeobacter sp.]